MFTRSVFYVLEYNMTYHGMKTGDILKGREITDSHCEIEIGTAAKILQK